MKSSLVARPQSPSSPEQSGDRLAPKTSIVIFGTSFKTSTLAFREALLAKLERDSSKLRLFGAKEYAQIVTCNRIEIVVATESPIATERAFLAWVSSVRGVQSTSVYVHRDLRAVSHLFQVASGLDSMVVGEEQILSQVKSAGIAARTSKSSKGSLSALFDASVNVGKRARATLKDAGDSVSSMSLRFALSRLSTAPKNVLLIGTGKTVRLAANQLGGAKLYVATRRKSLPSFPRVSLISHKDIRRVAAKCDLIISATKHRGYILKKGDLGGRRHVIVDLAFPRNVDPALHNGQTEVYNLDGLAKFIAGAPQGSSEEPSKLVASEAESFARWLLASRQSTALSRVYKWAEKVRSEESAAAIRRLPELSARERKVVEAMSRRMVSKILAPPTSFVKSSSAEFPQQQRLDLVSRIFEQGEE